MACLSLTMKTNRLIITPARSISMVELWYQLPWQHPSEDGGCAVKAALMGRRLGF